MKKWTKEEEEINKAMSHVGRVVVVCVGTYWIIDLIFN